MVGWEGCGGGWGFWGGGFVGLSVGFVFKFCRWAFLSAMFDFWVDGFGLILLKSASLPSEEVDMVVKEAQIVVKEEDMVVKEVDMVVEEVDLVVEGVDVVVKGAQIVVKGLDLGSKAGGVGWFFGVLVRIFLPWGVVFCKRGGIRLF